MLSDHETLQKKFDMLLVLGDIEIAQGLKKEEEKREREVSLSSWISPSLLVRLTVPLIPSDIRG